MRNWKENNYYYCKKRNINKYYTYEKFLIFYFPVTPEKFENMVSKSTRRT